MEANNDSIDEQFWDSLQNAFPVGLNNSDATSLLQPNSWLAEGPNFPLGFFESGSFIMDSLESHCSFHQKTIPLTGQIPSTSLTKEIRDMENTTSTLESFTDIPEFFMDTTREEKFNQETHFENIPNSINLSDWPLGYLIGHSCSSAPSHFPSASGGAGLPLTMEEITVPIESAMTAQIHLQNNSCLRVPTNVPSRCSIADTQHEIVGANQIKTYPYRTVSINDQRDTEELKINESLSSTHRYRSVPQSVSATQRRKRPSLEEKYPGYHCFTFSPTGPGLKKRKKSCEEKKKISKVRQRGACLRCRLHKLECSSTFPCENCKELFIRSENRKALQWTYCITSKLTELNVFSHGIDIPRSTRLFQEPISWGSLGHLSDLTIPKDRSSIEFSNLRLSSNPEQKGGHLVIMHEVFVDSDLYSNSGLRHLPDLFGRTRRVRIPRGLNPTLWASQEHFSFLESKLKSNHLQSASDEERLALYACLTILQYCLIDILVELPGEHQYTGHVGMCVDLSQYLHVYQQKLWPLYNSYWKQDVSRGDAYDAD